MDKISSQKKGAFSLQLKNAIDGQVVTRFPPEPSGYMHIGHLKAAILNYYYAKKYNGKMLIRFDDTNPAKEKEEYETAIMQDLEILGIKSDMPVSYTSNYFDVLIKYAEQLIMSGDAYVDSSPAEIISKEREQKKPSPNRNRTTNENLQLWKEMLAGSEEGQKCVLRAKIDYRHKNSALRDPTFYRCVLVPHAKTNDKYKVYPMYDFACPIVDSLEGVTHALRSSEYHARNELYRWVIAKLDFNKGSTVPIIEDFSRLNFTYTLLGKRHLAWFIDNGYAKGWDDPRFPTIRGLLRRGLTVDAMWKFILEAVGDSKNMNLMEIERLWAFNKKVIDPIVPRYTAVSKENIHTLHLNKYTGPEEPGYITRPKHPKNDKLGIRKVPLSGTLYLEGSDISSLSPNEEVTLIGWGNVVFDNGTLKNNTIQAELNLDGDYKTTKKKLNFLACVPDLVDLVLVEFDTLITQKKPDTSNISSIVNKNSVFTTCAYGESNMRELKKGDIIQLERRGFWIVDTPYEEGKQMVLFDVPDGHTKKEQSSIPKKVISKGFVDIGQSEKAKLKKQQKENSKQN